MSPKNAFMSAKINNNIVIPTLRFSLIQTSCYGAFFYTILCYVAALFILGVKVTQSSNPVRSLPGLCVKNIRSLRACNCKFYVYIL